MMITHCSRQVDAPLVALNRKRYDSAVGQSVTITQWDKVLRRFNRRRSLTFEIANSQLYGEGGIDEALHHASRIPHASNPPLPHYLYHQRTHRQVHRHLVVSRQLNKAASNSTTVNTNPKHQTCRRLLSPSTSNTLPFTSFTNTVFTPCCFHLYCFSGSLPFACTSRRTSHVARHTSHVTQRHTPAADPGRGSQETYSGTWRVAAACGGGNGMAAAAMVEECVKPVMMRFVEGEGLGAFQGGWSMAVGALVGDGRQEWLRLLRCV